MGIVEADALQEILEKANSWPLWGADNIGGTPGMTPGSYAQVGQFGASLRDLALWVSMRESDRDRMRSLIKWPGDREYRIDPLPDRICQAYSDLLFGENPEFTAGSPGDQDNLNEMIEANDLPSELRRWTAECISEGEIWWRVFVDTDISEWPILDANSRLDVVPYFIGRRIAAAAFVSDITSQEVKIENQTIIVVWRHVEIQTDELVRNTLYKGTLTSLGQPVPLTDMPETKGLEEEWLHGLPVMLAGRIPNRLGRDWRLGVSEFQGIKDLLLDLNEARSIMAENARNTAKARMVVPASAIDSDGKFDAGQDVIVKESMDEALDGTNKSGPFAVLEYTFQAGPLLQHIDALINAALTRVGLAEQFVGGGKSQSEGQAFTGTALRTRLIPTTLAASGKARFWDGAVPTMLKAMQMVSALPKEKNGTGQTWSDSKAQPVMKRTSVLPEDLQEETQRHVMAVQGEIESIHEAVRGMHPDAPLDWVEAEIERIRADRAVLPGTGPNDIPNDGTGPGSKVQTPHNLGGSEQPGVTPVVDGQSPGVTPPHSTAGGPK